MFWGKGDTSKLEEDEKKTLGHLRRMEETGHIRGMDVEKSDSAFRATDFFEQWESLIKTMGSLRNIGVLVGGLLLMYWATEGAIVTFIQKIASGGS